MLFLVTVLKIVTGRARHRSAQSFNYRDSPIDKRHE